MIIKRTKNIEEIKSILCDKDIFNRIIGDKEIKPEDFDPPLENVVYIGGYEDNRIFAVSCFHKFRDGLKFHPHVLISYRLKYGREFVRYTATMLKCKLYVEIPRSRKRLINLARKLGFDSLVNNKDSTKTLMRLR